MDDGPARACLSSLSYLFFTRESLSISNATTPSNEDAYCDASSSSPMRLSDYSTVTNHCLPTEVKRATVPVSAGFIHALERGIFVREAGPHFSGR